MQGFIHPKINSLGDGHEVLLLVALDSGGEPSPCLLPVPPPLPASQVPAPDTH